MNLPDVGAVQRYSRVGARALAADAAASGCFRQGSPLRSVAFEPRVEAVATAAVAAVAAPGPSTTASARDRYRPGVVEPWSTQTGQDHRSS